ncbi:MAG TPA: hypothetical protein VH857_00795 [Actinomycetes bacterium]|jgi:hypothetical protein|nr:hypothetical protein [Actinomycetes bacterium]
MRGFRLTAVPAAVLAVAVSVVLVAATPASAAASVTHLQVVHAALTANDLGNGWHRVDLSGGGAGTPEASEGCPGTGYMTTGLRYDVQRGFQFETTPTIVHEEIQSFRTVRAAMRDFRKGLAQFTSCTTFTMEGHQWNVNRLAVANYADRSALFRLAGSVTSGTADVPLTMYLNAARYGHHEILTLTAVGGATDAALEKRIRDSSVQINKLATAKVRVKLGR